MTPPEGGTGSLQQLFRNALDVGGVHLALVRLHHVADQAPDVLGVGDAEGGAALLDERAHCVLPEAPRQIAVAQRELEAELRGLRGAALAELVELDERLLEL